MVDVAKLLEDIVRREGGYVNHPDDKGGPTNWGITQATLEAYRGTSVTPEDVQALTKDEALAIYTELYVAPFEAYMDQPALFGLLVDSAVQHGPARVKKWLAVTSSKDLYREILKTRIRFYGDIITRNPKLAVFARGWMVRITEFI